MLELIELFILFLLIALCFFCFVAGILCEKIIRKRMKKKKEANWY